MLSTPVSASLRNSVKIERYLAHNAARAARGGGSCWHIDTQARKARRASAENGLFVIPVGLPVHEVAGVDLSSRGQSDGSILL